MEATGQLGWTPSRRLLYIKNPDPPAAAIPDQNGSQIHSQLQYCSYATLFALRSAQASDPTVKSRYLNLATGLTETCHKASNSSRTWLPYENFTILPGEGERLIGQGSYDLGPTVAETYFTMYRLTGDYRYRNYAWDLASHLDHFAAGGGSGVHNAQWGYATVGDVNRLTPPLGNRQPPHLFATLKFLFLTFSKVDYIPLEQWVFTASGHPLPICGKNPAYPANRCLE